MSSKKFLSAEWRKLIMANYTIDPALLTDYIPANTELDTWNKKCYVSLVGFMFLDTRVLGVKVPFHTNFPEVNLRFYVRYKSNNEWKRGVVFIREIVPKPALTFVANKLFKERYLTMPMENHWNIDKDEINIRYAWKAKQWNSLEVKTIGQSQIIQKGSEEEFITEHYWGYTSVAKGKTAEYRVEHSTWEVYPVNSYHIECDFQKLYGRNFGQLNDQKPESVFLAEGSAISVYYKKIL